MTDIARLILEADTSQLKGASRDLQEVSRQGQITAGRVGDIGKSMMRLGGVLSLSVTAPIAAFGISAFDAAVQSREAFAQVEAALESMGGASGKTATELQNAAKQLETFSNFDDDDILAKVTANLLTFGNVSGSVFDRAQQAAVDLSARLGQDLQSSAIQLGRALNDPITGVTALSRVGVSFTEDQKALIKAMVEAGDVAGAQSLILAELEKQYGGAARAAREAAPGGDQLQAWRTLQEVIGERLVVAFEQVEKVIAPILNAFLRLPEGVQTAAVVVGALAAAAGPLLVVLGGIVSLAPAIAAGFAAVSAAALPIAAIVAGVAAAGLLIYQNWDKIGPVLDSVAESFREAIGPQLQRLIEQASAKLTELWEGPLGEALRAAMEAVEDFQAGFLFAFGESLVRVLNAAISVVGGAFDAILGVLTAVSRFLQGDFAGAWEALKGVVYSVVNVIAGAIEALFPGLLQMGKDIIRGIINGIKAAPGAVRDALMSVVMAGVDSVKSFLGIRSPSLLFMEVGRNIIQGLAIGIEQGQGVVGQALSDINRQAEVTTDTIAENFAQMSQRIMGSLEGLARGIKSGDFLSIFGGILDIFTTLGSAGVFGSNVKSFLGATNMSMGGPVQSGRPYIVGERGPELFMPGSPGRIVPNNDNGVGGVRMTFNIDARGATSPEMVRQQVQQGILEAAPSIVAAAEQRTISTLRRPRLAGAL